MFFRAKKVSAGPVVPLSEGDVRTVSEVATSAAGGCSVRVQQARGQVVLRSTALDLVGPVLSRLGYVVESVDMWTLVVAGWRPLPGTATVAEIDARIDALYALRAEAEASNRLAVEA